MEKLEVKSGTRTGLTEKEREISANAIQRHVETEERVSRLRAMHHSTLDEEDEEDGEYLLHGYVQGGPDSPKMGKGKKEKRARKLRCGFSRCHTHILN